MDILVIPQISISLAPPEEQSTEPYSPFSKSAFLLPQHDEDFRPVHLTPPPIHARFARKTLVAAGDSPSDEWNKATGRGLEPARFAALLKASQQSVAAKRDVDLRKEVALKAHRHKQVERRKLFLTKVLAKPEPLSVYEHNDDGSISIGQPDATFKLLAPPVKSRPCPLQSKSKPAFNLLLPSLDQISERVNAYRSARLLSEAAELPLDPAPVQVIGRLRMPVRPSKTMPTIIAPSNTRDAIKHASVPHSAAPRKVRDSTMLAIPLAQSISPTEVPRINLLGADSRQARSSAMLSTLRLRTQSDSAYKLPATARARELNRPASNRRHSAPPDTAPYRDRRGFEHPILSIPGSF